MKKILLFITFLMTSLYSFGQVPTSERDALIALYNSADGVNWTKSTNWNTADSVSKWHGITVTNLSGQDHVTQIDLTNNNLSGPMPIELGNLSKLEYISFWKNNLTGNIPSELGNCINLTTISFEDNQLTGNIPSTFANLTLMTSFWLNGNRLSGVIPDIFSNWTNLAYFSIGDANATGSYNNFTGALDFSNNSAMTIYWIDHNSISSLNIRNGNNINTTDNFFNISNNPNLTCVIVDDTTYSSTNWTQIDSTVTFVENQSECSNPVSVDDLSFESKIVIYPNPTNNIINFTNIGEIEIKKILIANSLGQTIIETEARNSIDISNFSNGIYLIIIEDAKGIRANYKIVKN